MPPFFDPSKMDPKLLAELSELVRQLPPAQLSRMQTLMHNMMAGFDVTREMEEFERSLPPGFREKVASLMARQGVSPMGFSQGPTPTTGTGATYAPSHSEPIEVAPASTSEMGVKEARLTLLRAVAGGQMTPEEALPMLFPEGEA